MKIKKGLIKRLHVNKHIIRSNLKNKKNEPPLTIQTSQGPIRAHKIKIHGPSTLIHGKPLSCGARVYLETTSEVEILE